MTSVSELTSELLNSLVTSEFFGLQILCHTSMLCLLLAQQWHVYLFHLNPTLSSGLAYDHAYTMPMNAAEDRQVNIFLNSHLLYL